MAEKKDNNFKRDIEKLFSNQKTILSNQIDTINTVQNFFNSKKEINKINKIKKKIQKLNNRIKIDGIKKDEIIIKDTVFNEFKNTNKDNNKKINNANKDNEIINHASVVINKKSNKKY